MRIPLFTAVLVAVATVAEADIITLNASDFARGTNITQAVTDVRLQRLDADNTGGAWNIVSSDVFAAPVFYQENFNVALANTFDAEGYESCRRGTPLRVLNSAWPSRSPS
jgi:hypothetical protein